MSTATATRRRSKRASSDKDTPKRRRGPYRATPREAGEDYGSLGRPVWSGSISFGLVNIPIRLHTAVREQRVAFHQLHDQDKVRLRRRFVCPADGKEIHPEHLVRGFEFAKDQYVIVRDDELEGCAPEKTKAIEITDFVKIEEIDPLYFDRPYYVVPQAGASKSYRLLAEAMQRTGRVGLARIVMHEKEHLAALRTLNGLLCLETMHFAEEVVSLDEIAELPHEMKLSDKEVKGASRIIDDLADDFDPKDFRDTYQKCLREMLEKKAKAEGVVEAAEAGEEPEESAKPARSASNLMAALEASLAHAKRQSTGSGGGKRRKSA